VSKIYILDSCAVIALVKKETGWETVFDILRKAINDEATVFMHELNLLEVFYGFYRERGKEYAEKMIAEATKFFSVLNGLSDTAFAEAGRLKASYKMSLADSVALSQAFVLGASLITADHHEFDTVEKSEKIAFLWFR